MPNPERPTFYNGQVITAPDLAGTVDHARARAARHDRYLHEWGIAEGLTLTTEPATDPDLDVPAVAVTVQPGLAVDGTGRDVVVPAPVVLQEALFQEVNGADPDPRGSYPVFLAGLDRDPVPAPIPIDACGATAQRSRVEESYQIIFGRLGDERLVGEQRPPAVADGPGDGSVPWLILLGYVRWQGGHFTGVVAEAGGVGRRYAGVRADTVAARGGGLTLRSQLTAAEGGPVVTVGARGLAFGLYKADGTVDSLLAVSPRGDLTVRGTIAGGQRAGTVTAVSGVATDGMILPLPAGVSAEQVNDGRILLHTSVTPHLTDAPPATDGTWLPVPVECTVDGDRRLRCRIRWLRVADPLESRDEPGTADFVVVATVAPTEGSGT